MAALKKIAVLFYEGNDEITFDGTNKVSIAVGEDAAALNALESGTILYKAHFNGVSGKQAVLGTDTGCYVGSNENKFRHELGGGFMGNPNDANMTAGADNTAGFIYDDSNGHWALSSNGAAPTVVDLDESKFGMMTAVNASTYYAGGSSAQGFSGTINYTMANGYASQAGSGGFNADGNLMLRDLAGDPYKHGNGNEKSAYLSMATSRSYDFYLDPNADGSYTIRRVADDSAVADYSVDAMLNIRSADGSVDTHLFMADSPYQVYPTNYLYLTKSTDGLNWSAPQLIVAKNASESAYLIGPGSGTYDAVHGNMVFTAYSYSGSASSQKTSLLWAGKDGVWHRSEDATTDVWSSEASAVVLDNGTVRVFYRSGSNILCYTDYLWVDGTYVRDVNNTSVSTGAVKNSGNGCMLSAVKYPEKVNGREMILVATPVTTNSRSDGHIYAFYVNKNGTMELVADYDITPGEAEYYAYSCLTVLTRGEEAGDLALFWEDSWASSPAAATIRYSVIEMEDVLAGVKEAVRQEVNLTVGAAATFEDMEGYYVGADTSELDPAVASVDITGTVTRTAIAADEAVSVMEDGTYILINTRAGKSLTNGTASADGGNGLSLDGTRNNVPEIGIWTVRAVNGGFTVQDASGKYLTIGSNNAGLSDAESVVKIERNGDHWTISQNGAYLNDFGGKAVCAAGWQHSSAKDDGGSQWMICTVKEVPVEGTSRITFTGVGVGQTSVLIGNTIYNITVTGEVHEHKWSDWTVTTAPTCTEKGVETRSCVCGEKETREVSALGHNYENGVCTRCGDVKNPFTDVPVNEFYFTPVMWAVENGITNGATATTFDPNGQLQRAQFVTMLWRAAGKPEPTSAKNPFKDVKESGFFYKAVLWAVENEITNGISTNEFGAYSVTNRAQAVTFLWRYLKKPEATATNSFSDVKAGLWYEAPINWAVGAGVTNGISATEFGIDGDCNRAQAVTFLYRALAK